MMRNMSGLLLLLLINSMWTTQAFVVPSSTSVTRNASPSAFQLQASKKKGFGEQKTQAPKKKKAPPSSSTSSSSPAKTTVAAVSEPPSPKPETSLSGSISSPDNPFNTVQEPTDLSLGKAALERMRRDKAEERNAELRQIKQVKDVDAMLRESPEAAAIPERVAQRMGKRMLPFVGIPLFGGMTTFVGFWYMATYRDTQYEPLLVALSTIGVLVAGLLGITYSVMSASWDPDREGSFLGTEEFGKNLGNIREGLSRSRENARLRDKALDISNEEMEALDRNDNKKKQVSFDQKIGDEFD